MFNGRNDETKQLSSSASFKSHLQVDLDCRVCEALVNRAFVFVHLFLKPVCETSFVYSDASILQIIVSRLLVIA